MRYSRCTGAYRRRRIACCRTRPPNLLVPLVTLARRNQRTLTEELRRVARTSTTVHVVTLAGTRRRLTRWWTSSATTRSKGATSFSNFWSSSGPTIARSVYLPFFFSFFFCEVYRTEQTDEFTAPCCPTEKTSRKNVVEFELRYWAKIMFLLSLTLQKVWSFFFFLSLLLFH